MPIEPIKKSNVSEEVFEQIKALISSGEWGPGEKVPSENELAKMFQVSRITIRSALSRLGAFGMVISKQGEGTFVGRLNPQAYMDNLLPMLLVDREQLLEVYEFRRIIDVGSAKMAAQNADERDIREMEENIEAMRETQYGVQRFAELDVEFHYLLAKATKNAIMQKVYTVIKEILLAEQTKQHTLFGPSGGLKYHPLVLEAVKARDGEEAGRIMERHLTQSIENLKKSRVLSE